MAGYRKARKPGSRRTTGKLNDQLHKELVTRAQAGAPMYLCAQSCGVPERTLSYWMRRGFDEDERLAEEEEAIVDAGTGGTPTPDPVEAPYLALYRDMVKARANGGIKSLAALRKAELGGQVIKETTRTYRDHDGRVVTEVEVTKTAPDWRAAAWYLERTHRSAFGKDSDPTRVEIVGADGQTGSGGEGGDLPTRKAEELSARVLENIAALTAASRPQIESAQQGDVMDAEVVDD